MTVLRDPALQAHFDRHGYAIVDLLGEREVAGLRETWRELQGKLAWLPYSITASARDKELRLRVHEAVEAALAGPLARHVDGYRLLVGLFINKGRGAFGGEVALHQDWTLIDESTHQSTTLWCPLVDVDPENGCLRLAPGSHRLHAEPRPAEGTRRPFLYERVMPILEAYVRPLPMRAGQAVIMSNRLYHGSRPNLRDAERPVVTCACIPVAGQTRVYFEGSCDDREEYRVYDVGRDFLLRYHADDGVEAAGGSLVERLPFSPIELLPDQVSAVLEAGRID